jgi:hypothetical protein
MTVVRILASGIDTLHLFTRSLVLDDVATTLAAAKERAATTPRAEALPIVDVAGHALTMERHGARTAPFLLDSEHLAVRVNPHAAENLPSIAVELRALYLWQRGAHVCAAEAQRVADAFSVAPLPGADSAPLRVSRVDLAVDFQGWQPRPEDDARMVTRAATRTTHRQGATFTGFMFGHGVIAARLYDKTTELRKSGKSWFRRVWAQSGAYDARERVWRLEFQVRREALRALRARTPTSDARDASAVAAAPHVVDTWQELLALAPALWRHLATRWLALRLPRTKATRQRLVPEWAALAHFGFAAGTWSGADADLYREAREVAATNTTAQLAGYLAAGLAAHRYLVDPAASLGDALPVLVERAQRHVLRRGTTLDARAQERVDAWERQAEALSHGSAADAAAHDERP